MVTTSKFLSWVLRHEPEAIGLALDKEGWVDVATLIARAAVHGTVLTEELIREVVRTSDKKRFTLSEDGLRIRAAQGHTTQTVALSHPVRTPPAVLYHGTAEHKLPSIQEKGLLPGERHDVHLSATLDTAVKVGARHGTPAIIEVDCVQMLADGFEFRISDNGVWLTGPIPVKYLRIPPRRR